MSEVVGLQWPHLHLDGSSPHVRATEYRGDDDLVFPGLDGQPLHVSNVRRRTLEPAVEEAGAGWAGFHTFRHSYVSMLFERGANAKQVQRALGHHSAAFTLATYVRLLDGDEAGALGLDAELTERSRMTAAALAETDQWGLSSSR